MAAEFPFADPRVEAVFAIWADDVRERLLALRRLIIETAAYRPEIGEIVETLKWGEPAYLPARPRVGTTVRINALKETAGGYALYFHCQTTLIDDFRQLYPKEFAFEGNRAITFTARDAPPIESLRHCIALALTYHLSARPVRVR